MNKLVIGLTGGIGSGKSTVATLFEQHGITVIDADQVARDIVKPGEKAYQCIVGKFGDDILNEDRSLNRPALRQQIFSDGALRTWLENLLHPAIRQYMQEAAQQATSPYCILMIPLLFETEPNPIIDRSLLVDTTKALQLSRSLERDQTSELDIKNIIDTQMPRDARREKADDLIDNSKDLSHLEEQVAQLHQSYLKRSAV